MEKLVTLQNFCVLEVMRGVAKGKVFVVNSQSFPSSTEYQEYF